MFKNILVALDGTPEAEQLQTYVRGIASKTGASVTVLTVLDPDDLPMPDDAYSSVPTDAEGWAGDVPSNVAEDAPPGMGDRVQGGVVIVESEMPRAERLAAGVRTQVIDQAVEQARRYLMTQAQELEDAGVTVDQRVAVGDPAEEIMNVASAVDADLIAMATHRSSAISRSLFGSVTDTVIQNSGKAGLVARTADGDRSPDLRQVPQTVIVPLDSSSHAQPAAELGIQLASKLGARITFVQGAPDGSRSRSAEPERFQDFIARAEAAGLVADSRMASGDTADEIQEEAESSDSPLVVMQASDGTGLSRWLMGSVSDQVVRSGAAAVLLLPPDRLPDQE